MKVNRHGQAKILTSSEINMLFTEGFVTPRDRALFGICLYTGCRISEALALKWSDIGQGFITIRKATTKGKTATRQADIHQNLSTMLEEYRGLCKGDRLFPGRGTEQLSRVAADGVLRQACKRCGIDGVSTHSFRRTALTRMNDAGISLRVIQEISGHTSLAVLQRYLAVSPGQVTAAIASLQW